MKKNFTRNQLAERINIKLGYSKEEAKEFIEIFFDTIKENISNERIIKISKLGTFKLLNKNKRIGRNPKTNDEFIISARKTVKFIPAKLITKNSNI